MPVGFTVAAGLVLGLGFGHFKGAATNTAASVIVNEVRYFTQPTSSIAAWEHYQRNPDDAGAQSAQLPQGFSWSIAWSPTGGTLFGTF